MAYVAIELERDRILVAGARLGKGQCQLDDVFDVPLTDENDAEAGEKLKSALSTHGFRGSDVIVIVSRSSVEMREVTVPPTPDEELPEMVRFLARNEFASLNENWLLDYIPLGTDASVGRTVLAVGVSPEFNRQLNQLVETAGLRIKHMVLRPFAAIDLLRNRLTDQQCRLIVNQNDDLTDLTIVAGIHPIATRTVRSLQSTEPEQRSREAVSKIKQTFASSAQNLGNRQVEEVIIFGDAQENVPFRERLEKDLNLKVEFIQPFDLVETASKIKLPEFPSRYAALLGSLVQQSCDRPHLLDFIHPRKPVEAVSNRNRYLTYGGIAAAAALMLVAFCWWTLRSQGADITQLESELKAAIKVNEGDGKSPNVDQIMGEVSKIDQWKKSDVNWLEELYQFSGRFLTPDDAIVDTFEASLTRAEPRIVLKVRGSGTQTEDSLNQALRTGPYDVTQGKTSESDLDPAYVSAFDVTLVLTEDPGHVIDEINEKTTEFLKQRNSAEPK